MKITPSDLKALRGLLTAARCVLDQMTRPDKREELKLIIARGEKIHSCLLYALTQSEMSFTEAVKQGVPDNHALTRGVQMIAKPLTSTDVTS